MRILQIASGDFFSTYGGGQVYVKNIVDHFINKGVDVCIISFVNIPTSIKKEYKNKVLYEVPKSISEEHLKKIIQTIEPNIIHTHSKKDITCRIADKLRIPIIVTSHHGGILCPAGALLNYKDHICYTKINHKDCLPCVLKNTRTGLFFWYPFMKYFPKNKYIYLGKRLSDIRFLPFITPIGSAAYYIASKEGYWQEVAEKCTVMIAPSEAIAKVLITNGLDKNKIKILPHGIPQPSIKPSLPKINNERIKFFYVGRICEIKGIHIILQAFKQIKNKEIELHLIGGASNKSERRYLNRMLKISKKDDRFIWHGKTNPSDIFEKISSMHVGISASICMEIFGLNIAEALVMGKPVIASKNGGSEMQIKDGVNGWLIEPNNSEQLKTKIEEIINNPSILSEMSKNCNAFSISEHCDSLIKIYKETINKATT